MLRIVFEPADLGRVRVAGGADPMWEIVLSLHRLRRHDPALVFERWRRQIRGAVPRPTRLLADLMPPRTGYFADFLTPAAANLSDGLEALQRTPKQRLRADLTVLRERATTLPAWTNRIAEPETMALLASAAKRYFDVCLAPYWDLAQARIDQERFRLARLMADLGTERMLAELHPTARWRPPVLELGYPVDHELRLGGRGLTLMPSFYCWGTPTTFRDGDLQPVLVCPIRHDFGWACHGRDGSAAALLGRTRTIVLRTVAGGSCTTSELAGRSRVPLATASRQASVLRDAGLVTSRRTGQAVVHSITPLGLNLLAGR